MYRLHYAFQLHLSLLGENVISLDVVQVLSRIRKMPGSDHHDLDIFGWRLYGLRRRRLCGTGDRECAKEHAG